MAGFDCGEPALDDWLRQRALKNESRFSRTYVVCEGMRVVAFYCISAGAMDRAAAPGRLRRNAPDAIPVSVIGRLAVARSHAGRGLGADILSDALARIAVAAQSIGIAAVVVQAKDERGAGVLHGLRGVHRVSDGQPDALAAGGGGGEGDGVISLVEAQSEIANYRGIGNAVWLSAHVL